MKFIISGMLLLIHSLPARADEDAIKLKAAEGIEAVEQNCAACHSLDYIQMNSVFLDGKGWSTEVTKMVKTFGAPITEDDQARIIKYLSANFGR
jgi:sulfite dehydrogenase (cytochrome) subunit B